jgi:hypothetical protein
VDLAAVDLDAAGLLDGVRDVLGRHRAEEAAVLTGLLGDRQHRAIQRLGALLRTGQRLLLVALLRLLAAAGLRDRALGRRLGELARAQEVAQVALGDVDHGPLGADALDVLEEDRLRHRYSRSRSRSRSPRRRPTRSFAGSAT